MKPLMTAKKIAKGLNCEFGAHIVINTSDFYSERGNRETGTPNLVRMYVIRDCYYSSDGTYVNEELFKSASAIYTLLYMRDLLYKMRGQELPPDDADPGWTATRLKKGAFSSFDYMVEKYVLKGRIIDESNSEPSTRFSE